MMPPISDHPLRYRLANELHARPFPSLGLPGTAAFLAIKQPENAASRDRSADLVHLIRLLDRFGAPHPQPGATHYFGPLGRHLLKWESHTEFVTYTIFNETLSSRAFDPADFELFPEDWLAEAPGQRMTSALIRVVPHPGEEQIMRDTNDWFEPESLAVSNVLDGAATMAADFRIDPAGHLRFAVFVQPGTGPRRIGRIVQRLCEIETYKTMSMLGLSRARDMSARMGKLDGELSHLISHINSGRTPETTLEALLRISAELETCVAHAAFRFGATRAYEAIVKQRIEVLRETRFEGRQTFHEFMMRRFDPAMRTVTATERQLDALANRARRAGELLRTKVDVARSAQNQKLLESMDRRADAALRLQETVEGLSVVAISYYAVSLVTYAAYPLTGPLGLSKGELTAALTIPVVAAVWLMIRRVRARMR